MCQQGPAGPLLAVQEQSLNPWMPHTGPFVGPDTLCFWVSATERGVRITYRLNVEREDGTRFRKPAVVDEVGDPGNGVPAAFHFEWEPGDLVRGRHHAEVEVFDGAFNETTRDRIVLDVRRDFGP